jgi:hypothetical protein
MTIKESNFDAFIPRRYVIERQSWFITPHNNYVDFLVKSINRYFSQALVS